MDCDSNIIFTSLNFCPLVRTEDYKVVFNFILYIYIVLFPLGLLSLDLVSLTN